MKECPLRKTCQWCGKEYGRKLRAESSGRLSYEDKHKFLTRSKYCSRECFSEADGERRRKEAEQRRKEQAESADRLNQAIHRFIYS